MNRNEIKNSQENKIAFCWYLEIGELIDVVDEFDCFARLHFFLEFRHAPDSRKNLGILLLNFCNRVAGDDEVLMRSAC